MASALKCHNQSEFYILLSRLMRPFGRKSKVYFEFHDSEIFPHNKKELGPLGRFIPNNLEFILYEQGNPHYNYYHKLIKEEYNYWKNPHMFIC